MARETLFTGGALLSGALLAVAFAGSAFGQAGDAAAPTDEEIAALQEEGATVFGDNCAGCHGGDGGGSEGPTLAGNEALESRSHVLNQILFGGAYMPEFGNLSDREIAAVATFVRTSWGNDFGAVVEAEVTEARGD